MWVQPLIIGMVAKEISSLQHPLVKQAVQLRCERKAREMEMRAVICGRKLIHDLAAFWPIDILFIHDDAPPVRALETIRVSPAILKKITGLDESDGWAAIVPLPPEQPLQKMNAILVLDQVCDPGNLGTLWRTALGLGWQGVWLTPGSADPFNDKALRASQGAVFRLPYERVFPDQILSWSRSRQATIYTADLVGTPIDQCKSLPPLALVLGNEGQGPGSWTNSLTQRITIPISTVVESLNVASAGAILLYAMRPNR